MNVQDFCEKLQGEPAFAAKMAATSTTEEALSLAAEEGFSLSAEELENLPLSDENLAQISGGVFRPSWPSERRKLSEDGGPTAVITYGAI